MSARSASDPALANRPGRFLFLDHLRAVGIVMVVGVHAVGYCAPLPPVQYEIFRTFVHTASVPIFFLTDGFLFAARRDRLGDRSYADQTRRDVLRLIIPWVVFTVLYTLARFAFERVGVLDEHLIVEQPWRRVALRAYASVYAPQLYFLTSLFLLRRAGPLLAPIARMHSLAAVIGTSVAVVALYKLAIPPVAHALRVEGGQEPVLHGLWGLQYFLLGVVCQRVVERVAPWFVAAAAAPLFFVALAVGDRIGAAGGMASQYLYLVVLLFAFAAAARPAAPLDWLGRNTMGIYLLHAPVVLKVVAMVVNRVVDAPAAGFLTIVAGALLVSCGLVAIVHRIPQGGVLFGEPAAAPRQAGERSSRRG